MIKWACLWPVLLKRYNNKVKQQNEQEYSTKTPYSTEKKSLSRCCLSTSFYRALSRNVLLMMWCLNKSSSTIDARFISCMKICFNILYTIKTILESNWKLPTNYYCCSLGHTHSRQSTKTTQTYYIFYMEQHPFAPLNESIFTQRAHQTKLIFVRWTFGMLMCASNGEDKHGDGCFHRAEEEQRCLAFTPSTHTHTNLLREKREIE